MQPAILQATLIEIKTDWVIALRRIPENIVFLFYPLMAA